MPDRAASPMTSRSRSALRRVALLGVVCVAAGCQPSDPAPQTAQRAPRILEDLYAVATSDAQRAVAVGDHGAVYWTRDGGRSWHAGATAIDRPLYSVSMADAHTGWAVGWGGAILRTEDTGESWAEQPNPKRREGSHLLGVHAIDAETAWAVGVWGARVFTADGGETWIDRSVAVTPDSPTYEWLSTEDRERIRGGEIVYEDLALSSVFCRPRPSERCWVVGEFGVIFSSADRGQSWARTEIDAGESAAPGALGGEPPAFEATGAQRPFLFTVRFADDRNGLIAGLGGVVLRTGDGGSSWQTAPTHSRRALFSLAVAAERAVAIGEAGLALLSVDGGASWREPEAGAFPLVLGYLRDVAFDRSGTLGYIVGQRGTILRSGDSGRSWTRVAPPTPATARRDTVREPS